MLVDENCQHTAILQNAGALRQPVLSFDHLEPGPASCLADMLIDESIRQRPVNHSMFLFSGAHKPRAKNEQLPIPDVVNRPKDTPCSVDPLQRALEVCRIEIFLNFLPGLFHERESAQQVCHEIHEMLFRTEIHFFPRPIRERNFDIPPCEPAVTAEQKVSKPSDRLPKPEDP